MACLSYLKGYSYPIEAMVLVVNDHSLASQVTKKSYPQIAERFQTNAVSGWSEPSGNAIEITWERGGIDQLTQLFSFVDEERVNLPISFHCIYGRYYQVGSC